VSVSPDLSLRYLSNLTYCEAEITSVFSCTGCHKNLRSIEIPRVPIRAKHIGRFQSDRLLMARNFLVNFFSDRRMKIKQRKNKYIDETYHRQSSSNYQSSLFIHLQSWHYIIITLIQHARMSRGTVVVFDGGVTRAGYTFHEPPQCRPTKLSAPPHRFTPMRAPVSLLISHYTLSIAMYRVGNNRENIRKNSHSPISSFEFCDECKALSFSFCNDRITRVYTTVERLNLFLIVTTRP